MSENMFLSIVGGIFLLLAGYALRRVEVANDKADKAINDVAANKAERLQQFLEIRGDIAKMSESLVKLMVQHHDELIREYVTKTECRYKHEGD